MFVIGYIFIALEHQTGINKTAIALLLGILLWVMYIFSGPQIIVGADPAAFQNFIHQHPAYEHLSPLAQVREYILNWEIIDHLGNISEILFYLIGALTIVETIDVHQGFDGITRSVKTKNKKKLLWLVAFIPFFISSVLETMPSVPFTHLQANETARNPVCRLLLKKKKHTQKTKRRHIYST